VYALLSHACCILCPPHPPWLDHSNYIRWTVWVIKLLIMHFSPASYYSCMKNSTVRISFQNVMPLPYVISWCKLNFSSVFVEWKYIIGECTCWGNFSSFYMYFPWFITFSILWLWYVVSMVLMVYILLGETSVWRATDKTVTGPGETS
jgi:hypothetical protein